MHHLKKRGCPQLAEDCERLRRVLKSWPCEKFLNRLDNYFDPGGEYPAKSGGANPFVDSDGAAPATTRDANGRAAKVKYLLFTAVSRRIPVACSMRRTGHPSFPNAKTCCFFFFAQDIAHAERAYEGSRRSQCRGLSRWPVLGDQ